MVDTASAAPPVLAALHQFNDGLVRRLFLRAPFETHGRLHAVCRRLRTLLRSREFLQQRVDLGLAEYGLVAAGGRQGRDLLTPIRTCAIFNGGRWRPIPPLSDCRAGHCSAIVEDEDGQPEMWVMGGYLGRDWLATAEAYNPRTNKWRSRPSLIQHRNGAVAGVVGGRLVVAGGNDENGSHLTSAEVYTPNGWTPLPDLPHGTWMATSCVLNGRFYVVGGVKCNKLQVLEMSEENEFTWSVKADLPVLRDSAACAVVDGELWLMGGLNRALGETDSVFVYDIESDSWAAGPALPQKLRGCAAVHEEKVYLFYDRGLLVRDSTGWVDVEITAGGVGVRCAPGSIFLG